MWGGATFDTALRFLQEDPWDRLAQLRKRMPNILFQMLFRASNALGYTNYPDNVVKEFAKLAAEQGMDVFRIFDSLNWLENMKVAMEAVLRDRRHLRGGDLLHRRHPRSEARQIFAELLRETGQRAGTHGHAYPGDQGYGGPVASRWRRRSWSRRCATKLACRFISTRMTRRGFRAAAYLLAAEAGVNIVDCAVSSMSGMTSQPNMNAAGGGAEAHAARHGARRGGAVGLFGLLGSGAAVLRAV